MRYAPVSISLIAFSGLLASAQVTYTYKGEPFTIFTGTYSCQNGIGECAVSGTLTLAAPLPANLDLSPDGPPYSFTPSSYSFTDGVNVLNQNNTSPSCGYACSQPAFNVYATDANSLPTVWNFQIQTGGFCPRITIAPASPPNGYDNAYTYDGSCGLTGYAATAPGVAGTWTISSCPVSAPCIMTPSSGASPQSQFVALSGTGTAGDKLDVLIVGLPTGQVQVDSEGNWEALAYVSPFGSSVTIQVQDQTSSNFSNSITVHPSLAAFLPGPPVPANLLTALLPLRTADIFVAASNTSPQYVLYGPKYTHTALYLGGDSNGTPLIAEAVTAAEAGPLIGTAGQVRSIPLDQSMVWTQSNRISAWHPLTALSGATRSAIVTWAQNITTQGLPYWSTADFGLIPAADTLFEYGGEVLSPRVNFFLGDLNALKNSTSAFICSTLVWRAYYEGTSHTLDLSNPNLLSAQPGSLMASYDPAFIAQLAKVFVVPETFARSPLLMQIF